MRSYRGITRVFFAIIVLASLAASACTKEAAPKQAAPEKQAATPHDTMAKSSPGQVNPQTPATAPVTTPAPAATDQTSSKQAPPESPVHITVSGDLDLNVVASSKEPKLALKDLANRPERWPGAVTMKQDIDFGVFKVKAGQKFKMTGFNGAELTLDAGEDRLIPVAPAECDFLDAANLAWASFTPEQRKLDLKTILEDASLWPEKVTCSGGFTLKDGKTIPADRTYDLIAITPQNAMLWTSEFEAALTADINRTDVVAGARALAALEPEKRPSRIAKMLGASLIGADGKPIDPSTLAEKRIFALYFSASWCAPCRAFTPDLVRYIAEAAPKNPQLMTVLMSQDEHNEEMLKYMDADKMPFPALPMSVLNKSPLRGYLKGSIPQLLIVDRYGKILADSYQGQQYVTPKPVLQALPKLLQSTAR